MKNQKEITGLIISVGLIIFTIMLGVIVYLWVPSIDVFFKRAPAVTCACERYGDDYLIIITTVEHRAGALSFKYYIENESKTIVDGNLWDIYNIDPIFQDENGNPITNVSFYDLDEDGCVSVGDVFYVRGVNNSEIYNNKGERVPGIGRNGLVFKLQYLPAGTMSCVINIADNVSVNTTFVKHHPLNKWNIAQHPLLPNLTISTINPCLSAYPPMYGQNTSIQVILNNTDNIGISNLSVVFYDSDIEIKRVENISVAECNKTRVLVWYYFDHNNGNRNISVEVNYSRIVALESYCEVTVIQPPAFASSSFDVNIAPIIVVVLIAALLATFKNRRGRK